MATNLSSTPPRGLAFACLERAAGVLRRLSRPVGPVLAGAGLAAFGSEAVFLVGAAIAVAMGATVPLVRRRTLPPQGEEIAATPANPVP